MIIDVTENVYKGILLERVKDKGWKCELGGDEYLFPHYTAAQSAIDEIFANIKPVTAKQKAVKLKKDTAGKNEYTMLKQLSELLPDIMQGEYERLELVLTLLNKQKEALQNHDYAEAERLNKVLLDDTEANIDSYCNI